MSISTRKLYDTAFQGRRAPGVDALFLADVPEGQYAKLDISKYKVSNPQGFPVENCFVWFPVTHSGHVKPMLEFFIRAPVKDFSLFLFAVPHKRAKLRFSLKGSDHRAVIASQSEMKINTKMVGRSTTLVIGEDTYIGGATFVLNRTAITIGAGGLLSDEVLFQGTDSHGVVDLDTMKIINNGPSHITLKRHVWLGRRSSIIKNVTVEEGSIVAAGSVVVKNVPKACAVAGVPAKVVKSRVSWSKRLDRISDIEGLELSALSQTAERVDRENFDSMAPVFGSNSRRSEVWSAISGWWQAKTRLAYGLLGGLAGIGVTLFMDFMQVI